MGPVVVLAGGTGGAKLARGWRTRRRRLVVIANTGDDVEIYGAHVSPDPDLVAFWLADRIDGAAGGCRRHVQGDGRPARARRDVWFNLGDRDLAIGHRARAAARRGRRLTETLAELGAASASRRGCCR